METSFRRVTDANELQRKAEEILSQSRFHERRTPSPFRGLIRQLGDWLDPLLGPIGRFFGRIFEAIARWWDQPVVPVIVVIVVIGLAVAVCVWLINRRGAVAIGGGSKHEATSDDPAVLERAADQAEAAGHYPEAVRLRFRAGVLRLQNDGRIRRGRSTPTRAIGRQLKIQEFDRLGRTFDEVAYGHREASAADAADSKRDWQRVLAEAGRQS